MPPETLPRRKYTETTETSGRKEEEGAGAITHTSSLHMQHFGKAWP
jgi:hypothetical protein